MRILVVDSDSLFRQTATAEFTAGGYEVVSCASGHEALRHLEETAFDLVVLATDMPDLDGFATCARMRTGTQPVRVVMTTPRDPAQDRARGASVGVVDFLRKKRYRPGDLLNSFQQVLHPEPPLDRRVALLVNVPAVASLLREAGVTVLEVPDVATAWRTLTAPADTDLIVVQGDDGVDMCHRLHADEAWQDVPVVLLTAASSMDRANLYAAGAVDTLQSPCSKAEMLSRLLPHLEIRRLRRQLDAAKGHLKQRVKEAVTEIRAANAVLEQRLREATALNQVALALNASVSPHEVLEQVSHSGGDVLQTQACSVYLHDAVRGQLCMAVGGNSVAVNTAADVRVEPVAKGEGVVVLAPNGKKQHFRQIDPHEVHNAAQVRLAVSDDVFGMLYAINKTSGQPFDTHETQILETFSRMASVAIKNARLLDETRKLAAELRDSLEKERWLAIEKEKMGAYVPKHVVDDISRNREQKLALGGKTVLASILFSDIQGFTRLSEHMPPQRLVSFLNEYMTALTRIVEEEKGVVDKFIGDAIMAVFLPAAEADNHAWRAVRAGVRMQQRLAALRTEWAASRPEVGDLQTRIGINTGEVVAGNIGSETRMDYTVVGDNVNVASRIESNGVGGQVHVSESTWTLVADRTQGDRLDPIHVKNREQPVQIYAITSVGELLS